MMPQTTVLLADDEDTLRDNLAQVLREEGFEVFACPDGAAALNKLRSVPVDVIITDLRMPGVTGMELIDHARKLAPDAIIVVITAFGQVETAVDAMKKGARDYLCKPLIFDELIFKLKRLVSDAGAARENKLLREQIKRTRKDTCLIGESPAIREIRKTIGLVSHTMSNVLIDGESGTGKEVLALALHHQGVTRDKPFVSVNCGGLVDTLVESELFGHRRGAFTGADSDRIGLFEAADGGSLFLDEISNLPMTSQAVLLRAIEEKAVTRVGDVRSTPVHIRIIAATNRDLDVAVNACEFREDLYYRLNVIRLTLPPLRERRDDIPLLVEHFVGKYNTELKCDCPGLDDEAMSMMKNHAWPGNVRELENVIERALIFAGDDSVQPADLSIAPGKQQVSVAQTTHLRAAMREYEMQYIVEALEQCDDNRMATAERLGIGLSSLYRKMEELGITKTPAGTPRAT